MEIGDYNGGTGFPFRLEIGQGKSVRGMISVGGNEGGVPSLSIPIELGDHPIWPDQLIADDNKWLDKVEGDFKSKWEVLKGKSEGTQDGLRLSNSAGGWGENLTISVIRNRQKPNQWQGNPVSKVQQFVDILKEINPSWKITPEGISEKS